MFLTAPDLLLPTIAHGFFGRQGGVSEGIYASLNCGRGSNDNREHVQENRRRVARALGAPDAPMLGLYQIHSSDVITVDDTIDAHALPKADALVTNRPNVILSVLAADCVPLLFADEKAGVIGAAHSGWKGSLSGIGQNTIEAMCALGAEKKRIVAAIGPCIAQASYEVGADFHANFVTRNQSYDQYFTPGIDGGHYRFNIKRFVRDRLAECGIAAINILENDTYIEEDAFFSYRRTTHRSEPDYGRQASVIMLKGS